MSDINYMARSLNPARLTSTFINSAAATTATAQKNLSKDVGNSLHRPILAYNRLMDSAVALN